MIDKKNEEFQSQSLRLAEDLTLKSAFFISAKVCQF